MEGMKNLISTVFLAINPLNFKNTYLKGPTYSEHT